MTLDEEKVPLPLRALTPYAEIWGVKDDVERCLLAERAPPAAKADLLALIGEFDDQFDTWLAGPEADARPLSAEYVAFSNMRMAFDYLSVLT